MNPYKSPFVCIGRLMREYSEHPRLIVALDFDDTVYDYHKIGYEPVEVFETVREAQAAGFYIVLFTGTTPDKWDFQKSFLAERGIIVDSVNENPIPLPFGNNGKIYYNILLDDRAGLGQSLEVLKLVLQQIKEIA